MIGLDGSLKMVRKSPFGITIGPVTCKESLGKPFSKAVYPEFTIKDMGIKQDMGLQFN